MDDRKITITGLSSDHVDMLDYMWELETQSEFDEWLESLSSDQLSMALQLKNLLMYELIDQVADEDVSYAKRYLTKFQL